MAEIPDFSKFQVKSYVRLKSKNVKFSKFFAICHFRALVRGWKHLENSPINPQSIRYSQNQISPSGSVNFYFKKIKQTNNKISFKIN
jgi:hypothetical protein